MPRDKTRRSVSRKPAGRFHQESMTIGIVVYQRRNQRQAVWLEKTEPITGSAKNPPLKPASCAALQLSDCKKVFFILDVNLRSI